MFDLSKLKQIDYPEAVAKRIRRRLSTPLGAFGATIISHSGIFNVNANYGSSIPQYLSLPKTPGLINLIKREIEIVLKEEKEYVDLVEVFVNDGKDGTVNASVTYRIKGETENQTLAINI